MRNLFAAILLIALPAVSSAQSYSTRSDSWEWSISAVFQDSKNISSENGSYLDVKSDTGFGLNMAYNLSDKLSVGMDLEFIWPNYDAVIVDDLGIDGDVSISHEMSQVNTRFKGTYNFFEGPFTPFVEAGLGWSYFDSNVTDQPPVVGCWWHPIWGYICDGFYDTFSETEFSYGAGAGIRYDFTGGTFIKASYNVWELDGLGSAHDSSLEAGRIEFGWNF